MAKRQAISKITASYHYLVKQRTDEHEPDDIGFTDAEFQRLVNRVTDLSPIDFSNEEEVERIKRGENLPFITHTEIDPKTHFGCYEGAYYGQEYRNTQVGTINADSLNLRRFFYFIQHLRDGKIIIGAQYGGNYGDYDGLRKCFSHILKGNEHKIVSRTFSSMRHEIGDGEPIELKLNIRRQNNRLGGASLFSNSCVFAIRKADYGPEFAHDVRTTLGNIRGDTQARKNELAQLVSNGELLEVNDEDIQGCTVLMRHNGRQHTVYLLGNNSFATKFPLNVRVGENGHAHGPEVQAAMAQVLRDVVIPGLRR